MNKAQLIDQVADAADLSKSKAAQAVEAVLDGIARGIAGGDTVSLVGFGTFSVRKRAARMGRNPQTGASIEIKASTTPVFKPGKALKDAVN